ncbi:MAG TPA: hypothetical protein VLF42_11145 [Burkholderiales bacterium]|nr:hypothetical protein [Burkholderiales bacterium]
MFVLDRLTSRSSRSLAVMIGLARSVKGGGRESLRGRPGHALSDFFLHTPPGSSAANPAFQSG